MSHYKPYPAYRESGVEWIGQVPEDWSLLRLANVGSLMKANGGNKQDDTDSGVPCVRYGDLYTTYDLLIRYIGKFINPDAEADYTTIQYGDILFAASGETFEEIGKSAVNLTETHAYCSGDIIVLRPQRKIDPVFLAYAAGSSSAQAQKSLMGKGFTVIHIYGDQIRNLVIAVPSEQEQKLIGAKIESETSRIDALITKKTRFIELLKEKRQALITHAVTKGLDPNVKMKDSGVEWIGEVPEHWGITRVKHVTRKESGHTPNKQTESFWIDCDIPWVSLKDSDTLRKVDYIFDTHTYINSEGLDGSSARMLPQGTVVFTRDATVGLCAITGREMAVSQHLIGWVPTGKVLPEYLLRVFESMAKWLDSLTAGATIKTIGMDDVGALTMPYPPLNEQTEIVQYINQQKVRLGGLIDKTSHSIDLLKERRSALITAAVTGQIDLRESV